MRPRITEGHRMLARNVWRLRELRGISASTLAEKLDWPLVMIEELERAERFDISLSEVGELADALDVEPYDLFRRSTH